MKRLMSFIAAASLTLGGIGLMGCESNDTSPRPGHDTQFGGGNGGFGTGTEKGGDYPSDSAHQPATQPAPAAQ
jgi:hypothetical protein